MKALRGGLHHGGLPILLGLQEQQMSESSIRGQILKLAVEDAELRGELVGILRDAGGLSSEEEKAIRKANNTAVVQQPPIVIQQPPIVVQQGPSAPEPPSMITPPVAPPQATPAIAPPPAPVPEVSPNVSPLGIPEAPASAGPSALMAPERTQNGFRTELLPELDRLEAGGMSRVEAAQQVLSAVQGAFSRKDMLYNILIRYQSSFESDAEFKANLEGLIATWAQGV